MKQPFNIIIADDEEDDQLIIRQALKEVSFTPINLTSVYDGNQLLDCLNKKGSFSDLKVNPNLILLDINMPMMDGFEALSHIKNIERFNRIPIVMLSVLSTDERIAQSKRLGANNLYSKPSQISDYRNIFQEVFRNMFYLDYPELAHKNLSLLELNELIIGKNTLRKKI